MLEVSHLTKKYAKIYANNDISFNVEDGSICIMLGPNGAGKSTAIKSIIGLLRHQGQITYDGIKTNDLRAKAMIGYVPEIPALYQNLTIEEHIEFVARLYKIKDYKEYAMDLVERFELSDKLKKFGSDLSKGMQQKVSLILGLITRPKLLICDEPLIGLDPHAIRELKNIFKEQKAAGNTILISTHIIDSIEDIWDKALIMKGGEILANVTQAELATRGEKLEDLYFELTESPDEKVESSSEEHSNSIPEIDQEQNAADSKDGEL